MCFLSFIFAYELPCIHVYFICIPPPSPTSYTSISWASSISVRVQLRVTEKPGLTHRDWTLILRELEQKDKQQQKPTYQQQQQKAHTNRKYSLYCSCTLECMPPHGLCLLLLVQVQHSLSIAHRLAPSQRKEKFIFGIFFDKISQYNIVTDTIAQHIQYTAIANFDIFICLSSTRQLWTVRSHFRQLNANRNGSKKAHFAQPKNWTYPFACETIFPWFACACNMAWNKLLAFLFISVRHFSFPCIVSIHHRRFSICLWFDCRSHQN